LPTTKLRREAKCANFGGRNDVEIAGEAGDGLAAIRGILELRPDVVFLDIHMPNGDGFEVLREVYAEYKPAVIFATAYDQYAIRAFEVEAVDYLLKPFTADRFRAALERALRDRLRQPDGTDRMTALLQRLSTADPRAQRVLVRKDDRLFFVRASDIEWIEAEDNYVILHTRTERHILRDSLAALEARLGAAGFVRIHRSHLVNLDALKEVVALGRGDCVAVLKSGAQLSVGRNYKDRLLESMGRDASS
jgi:two-component system LytT family response regulator